MTGASSGIGRATAIRLAARGYHVYGTVRKDRDAESLRAEGLHHLTPILLDVTDAEQVRSLAAQLAKHTASLDVLVNNAGTGRATPLETVEMDTLRQHFAVNVDAQVAVTQAMLPLIRAAAGTIVMIGSIADRITLPFAGLQASAKHAVRSISDALRRELSPWDIRVILIEPATIHTSAVDKLHQQVAATLATYTAEQVDLYGGRFRTMAANAVRLAHTGSPPQVVASTITKALSAKRPRARYLTGRHRRVLASIALLPAPIQDRLLAKILGLTKLTDG
ncbi:SDR family NAD(P)-dependent oxidoreductase [Kribbella sp. NPDC050459]|uniref:SDR family NAD(P)-dependent oxidoreductase n=1 Tax=Kribbella sp. NPDC050459 TaxID=3155785 RepID=UPI0033D0A722